MTRIIDLWVGVNRVLLRVLRITRITVDWEVQEPLSTDRWYLVISNHQGWSDILVLQDLFLGRIPPLKFFVKRQLLWVPFIGVAMWLLDFPYVYRFSREALAANPELRNKDQESVASACERFKLRPTAALNFVEGTRFTTTKHTAQQSPFRHLLVPKTGGVAAVLGSLGDRIHQVLDVTIVYPTGVPSFWDFLCGRAERIFVHVALIAAPTIEAEQRSAARDWVDDVWIRKDHRISELLKAS